MLSAGSLTLADRARRSAVRPCRARATTSPRAAVREIVKLILPFAPVGSESDMCHGKNQGPRSSRSRIKYTIQDPGFPRFRVKYTFQDPGFPRSHVKYTFQDPGFPGSHVQYILQDPRFPRSHVRYTFQDPGFPRSHDKYKFQDPES